MDAGNIALVHAVGLCRYVPGLSELVVPGAVVHLKIVIGVFAVIYTVSAQVEIVVDTLRGVADTSGERRLRVSGPQGNIMASGYAGLHYPLIRDLDRGQNSCIGEGVNGVKQRMAEHVVVGCELRLNAGYRDVPACPDVHALCDMREIDVDVLEDWIESILAIVIDQLRAEITFVSRETIVRSEERREMKTPIYVIALHRVGEPFNVDNKLIELNRIRERIIGDRCVSATRSAEVEGRLNPPVDLGTAPGSVDRRHQWINVGVRLANGGRSAVRPIHIGEGRRVEGGIQTTARRVRSRGGSPRPVLIVEGPKALLKASGGGWCGR